MGAFGGIFSGSAKVIPIGDCFRWANMNILDYPKSAKVVHARVHPSWNPREYWHAWIESGGRVFDWQSQDSRPDGIPKSEFYAEFTPKNVKRYTSTQAIQAMVANKHHGPWHDENLGGIVFGDGAFGDHRILHRLEICETPTRMSQTRLRSPAHLIRLMRQLRECNPSQEEFWIIAIDPIGRAVSASKVHVGTIDESDVKLPDVLKFVIASNVHRFIAFHNHPQGTHRGVCGASSDDVRLTRWLSRAAEIVGLVLLDHIIWCGGDRYFSFVESGRLLVEEPTDED